MDVVPFGVMALGGEMTPYRLDALTYIKQVLIPYLRYRESTYAGKHGFAPYLGDDKL